MTNPTTKCKGTPAHYILSYVNEAGEVVIHGVYETYTIAHAQIKHIPNGVEAKSICLIADNGYRTDHEFARERVAVFEYWRTQPNTELDAIALK